MIVRIKSDYLLRDLVQGIAELDQHAHQTDHLIAHRTDVCLHS